MTQHLGEKNPHEYLQRGHAIGTPSLHLPRRYGQKRAAESLGEVGPEDHTNGEHTGNERTEVNVIPFQCVGHLIDHDLTAIKNDQHHYQIRHTAKQR